MNKCKNHLLKNQIRENMKNTMLLNICVCHTNPIVICHTQDFKYAPIFYRATNIMHFIINFGFQKKMLSNKKKGKNHARKLTARGGFPWN